MRILHLTPYYSPAYAFGGVVRSVEGMTRALVRRGHAVTVLTTDAFDQSSRYTGDPQEIRAGVTVLRVNNLSRRLRGHLNLSTPDKMKLLAEEIMPEFDLVHCHEFRTVENLLVTPAASALGKPLILSPHGTLTRTTGRSTLKVAWDRVLSPAVAQRFDHIIGLTPQEVSDVRALWPSFGRRQIPAQFSVVPNGIDPEEYTNLPGAAAFRQRYHLGDAPVCLFMSRLHARKGVQVLIEAFKAANLPDARLVIAGPDEGMLPIITPLLDNRIVLTGYLDGMDRLSALAAADLLALPAVGEGLPMIVLEALGAGLPVLISPGCNLPQVADYGAGLIVEPQPEPLAEALRQLLTQPDQRAAMGVAGQRLIHDQFTWDAVAQQLEAIYEQHLPA